MAVRRGFLYSLDLLFPGFFQCCSWRVLRVPLSGGKQRQYITHDVKNRHFWVSVGFTVHQHSIGYIGPNKHLKSKSYETRVGRNVNCWSLLVASYNTLPHHYGNSYWQGYTGDKKGTTKGPKQHCVGLNMHKQCIYRCTHGQTTRRWISQTH